MLAVNFTSALTACGDRESSLREEVKNLAAARDAASGMVEGALSQAASSQRDLLTAQRKASTEESQSGELRQLLASEQNFTADLERQLQHLNEDRTKLTMLR